MKKYLLCSTALLAAVPGLAHAEDAAPEAPAADIIVTGTRQVGMKAEDSPAPIQLLGTQALQSVGQQDLTQVLAQSLPSLNFQGFGGDTANLTLSAALRGLSPNDTLVLVNGKRRHTTANLAVLGGSPYSGSATTDFSFIPTGSISRIEVLQDGAAAQYGSDAIAGVINVITKNADHGGTISLNGGSNYKNGGKTAAASANFGFKLGEKGFVNVTGEYRFHDYTQHGQYDRRFFTPTGTLLSSLSPVRAAGIRANPDFPNVNTINGDARYTLYNVAFNAGYEVSDAVQLYAFGSYGNRNAKAYENYRHPEVVTGTTSTGTKVYPLPIGFKPQENIREEDFSLTAGLKGEVSGWNYDLSLTYGKDNVTLYTIDSANPVLFSLLQSTSATPLTGLQRDFYDGKLLNSEWVTNLDISHDFEVGFAKPVTLALGAEYRRGTYALVQGEYASYIFGGGQSYPGFAPTDAGKFGRKSYAGYIDLAADPVESLHIDLAGRYEHYSDFGSAWSGKATARYDFSPAIALRGTVSNGFRAPTLAESYYSSVNVGPGVTFGQLPPNSAAAQSLGFARLQPEKSTNLSLGLVLKPLPGFQLTIDAYQIKMKNRIVPSGDIYGFNSNFLNSSGALINNGIVSQAVINALISRGVSLADATSYSGINIFTNGVDTRTRGVEATASYTSDFGDAGKVDWSLGLNYNKTEITRISPLPAAVTNALFPQTDLLSPNAQDGLSTATPRVKSIANALWSVGKFSVNLRGTLYGSTRQRYQGDRLYQTAIGTTVIADLNVGYKFTPMIRLDVGANNLFDKQAPTMPLRDSGTRPVSGNVFNNPLSYTPWGINGGYYYARATINF